MAYVINPNRKDVWLRDNADTMDISPATDASSVYLANGRSVEQELSGTLKSEVVTVDTSMEKIVEGTLDGAYQSAILKGSTKYKDVDTGEILDEFDAERNLELCSAKSPALVTSTAQNLSTIPFSFFEKTTDKKYNLWTIFEFDEPFNGKIMVSKRAVQRFMYYNDKENELYVGTTEVKNVQFIGFYNPLTGIQNNNKGNLLELLESGELDIAFQEYDKPKLYSYKKNDKTNILTTPQDMTLHKVNNICDTYNAITGEHTQYISERVYQVGDETNVNVITDMTKTLYVLDNPITTIVEPNIIPFAYENGYVSLDSASGILPTLEYATTISRMGQVTSNGLIIRKQEQQITNLEKILIQGIVSMNYNNALLNLDLKL